jgi:flagellin
MARLSAMMSVAQAGLIRLPSEQERLRPLARLATGLRIQRAGDDAAGLAIAERLTTTLRARGVIERGLNEAIGRVQQADDGLGRIAELLQQGRELALASANGSLDDGDRAGLQQGLRALIDQIDATAIGTRLFGHSLLSAPRVSGLTPTLDEVFGQTGRTLSLSSGLRPLAYLPAGMRNVQVEIDALGADDDLQVFTPDGRHVLGTGLHDISWRSNGIGTAAQLEGQVMLGTRGFEAGARLEAGTLLDGRSSFVDPGPPGGAPVSLMSTSLGGMTLGYSGDGDHHDGTPDDGQVSGPWRHEMLTVGEVTQPLLLMVTGSGRFEARASWSDAQAVDHTVDPSRLSVLLQADAGQPVQQMSLEVLPADSGSLGLASVGIATQEAAEAGLAAFDRAIAQLGQHRGRLGAMHGRLERALDLGASTLENLGAARGRLLDADLATELGTLTRQQVLAQAAQALRGQTAALPRQVLGLLLGG